MRRRRSYGSFKSSSSSQNPHSGRCKECGASIWWYRMTSGKFKPPYADQAMTTFHKCAEKSAERKLEDATDEAMTTKERTEREADFDMEAYTLGLHTQMEDLDRANQLKHLVQIMRHHARELNKTYQGSTHAS